MAFIEKSGILSIVHKTALDYFISERNKHTEPYQKFYDEVIELLKEKYSNEENGGNT